MRIQSNPYQPSTQPPVSVPAATPSSPGAATASTDLVRYSAKGVAAAQDYQVQYDQPSSRNRKAVAEYQSLDRQARKEEASSLLGVDLYV
ncbi:hypothetical protein [Gallaecimonas pentaromativorans]|uniref:Uncharacterized protein n=1 Tax=Gallaecimonas pentaromativorans TaxID=584787 RepID=A0A3N1PN19_9GAMM|nr:hypothetical protein [Pseudomonadota bacterium]ROQ30115.1 hypothetical protein EDC28_102508 [Gallaecimonas pentaromativorans]